MAPVSVESDAIAKSPWFCGDAVSGETEHRHE